MAAELMMTNENLILLHQKFDNYEGAIKAMEKLAKNQCLIDDDYLPAILTREADYPTGLELPVPIAIPHIDTGVKRSFVSITTLDEPVVFKSMDRSGDDVEARIVFVFGITDPNTQLEILKKFARSFSDKEKMMSLVETDSKKELIMKLNEMLDNMMTVEQ
ncbi:MAG: PTS sugar transporter subunit IIA [Hespellia sp.]|nr:PTS sugar transporter subunit IIA [Hespellia sp.]